MLLKFSKITFLVELSKKKSILVKIFENFQNVDFSNIFEKFRFWCKFSKNFVFFENFEKYRLGSNYWKISIFGQIFEKFQFWSNFRKIWKMSILVKFSKNFDFGQIFVKFQFWSKISKILDFFENFEKFPFC